MEDAELAEHIRELFDQLRIAKTLVDDGKEVKCSNQLQGAKTRCLHLLALLRGEADVVANDETQPEGCDS